MEYSSNLKFIKEIEAEQKMLQKLKSDIMKGLKASPNGSLRITSCRRKPIYTHTIPTEHGSVNKYIPKNNMELVKNLAQKEYDQQMLKLINSKLEINGKYLKRVYQFPSLDQVYNDMSENRQKLVSPHVLSDEQYKELWQGVSYLKKEFAEGLPEYYSDRGERVRSKSELIIAGMLYKRKIPYRYEYPVTLDGRIVVHPDFMILRMRDREDVLWEHFGMMDDPDYCRNALEKIERYQKNGYRLGDNLLITYETKSKQLETASIQRNIDILTSPY